MLRQIRWGHSETPKCTEHAIDGLGRFRVPLVHRLVGIQPTKHLVAKGEFGRFRSIASDSCDRLRDDSWRTASEGQLGTGRWNAKEHRHLRRDPFGPVVSVNLPVLHDDRFEQPIDVNIVDEPYLVWLAPKLLRAEGPLPRDVDDVVFGGH